MRTPEYTSMHEAADKIEPRLVRALELYAKRLARRIPIREIERALKAGDVRAIDELLNKVDFEDALEPSTRILTDAFVKGGKLTAKEIANGD